MALGVASGLEYLHMSINLRIYHKDLKHDNILLDDDMEPRIADFGLTREVPRDDTHMSNTHHCMWNNWVYGSRVLRIQPTLQCIQL